MAATLDVAPPRKKQKKQITINPRVLYRKEVRDTVRACLRDAYTMYPPEGWGHAQPWSYFKRSVSAYLLEASRSMRESERQNTEETEIKEAFANATAQGPSPSSHNLLQDAIRKAQERRKSVKPASGWRSFYSWAAEEVSSKTFFNIFRARHSNSDISEVYTTQDWDCLLYTSPSPRD